jgi:putative membrane protein
MNPRPSYLYRSFGFLILGSAVALAQTAADPAATTARMSGADTSFAKEAAIGGMSEVELGKLAVEKASDPRVKQFGQQMVDDHSKANDALKAAATQEGITLPTSTDKKHEAIREKLEKLSGTQFDEAYKKEMLRDHKEDVAAFEKHAKGASSPVQKFAADTLPTLQNHLQMIEGINGSAPHAGS